MSVDLFTARELIQKDPSVSTLAELISGGVLCADRLFIQTMLFERAFECDGENEDFAIEFLKHPKLRKDNDIWKMAEKARRDAEFIMLSYDTTDVDPKHWTTHKIEGKHIDVEQMKPDINQRGLHVLHASPASGKTEFFKSLIAKHKGTQHHLLVLVPNVTSAIALAKETGIAHYHTYGETIDDKRLAWSKHRQMVCCFNSYAALADDPNFVAPQTLIWDEVTEGIDWIKDDSPFATDTMNMSGARSLKAILNHAWKYERVYVASADMPVGYVIATLEDLSHIMQKRAFYYKTQKSNLKGSTYSEFESKEDLIFNTIRRIESGQRGVCFTDLADRVASTEFTTFIKIFKKHLPDANIVGIDRSAIDRGTPYGQIVSSRGFVEASKQFFRDGGDFWIYSPIAKSQHSIVFDEEEIDLVPDFCAAFSDRLHIASPWGFRNATRRFRQIGICDYWMDEKYKKGHHRSIRKTYGHDLMLKHNSEYAKINERSRTGPRIKSPSDRRNPDLVYYKILERYCQHREANTCNRNFTFRHILESDGAEVFKAKIEVSQMERDVYAEIVTESKTESELLKMERFENELTKRFDLIQSCYAFNEDAGSWSSIDMAQSDLSEINLANEITGETADRMFQILMLDDEARASTEQMNANLFYTFTGRMLDYIFANFNGSTIRQKDLIFADWMLHGDREFFLSLQLDAMDDFATDIENNYRNLKLTLHPRSKFGGSPKGVMKMACNEMGLDFAWLPKKRNRQEWREGLRDQLIDERPGKFKTMKPYSEDWYQKAGEYMHYKLTLPNFKPTIWERNMLDDMKDVARIEKKRFVSRRVIESFHWWLRVLSDQKSPINLFDHQNIEDIEKEITGGE